MEQVSIKATTRTINGSTGAKATRDSGMVPGVIYGGTEILHFEADPIAFKKVIFSADFKMLNIEINGKSLPCVLKSVQFHPVSEKVLHIDLLEMVNGKAVNLEIPVKFKGTSPGVKVGGKFVQKLRKVKVKTTPESLVSELLADISGMELGSSLRVRDLIVPKGIEVTNAKAIPIASIEIPRALRNAKD